MRRTILILAPLALSGVLAPPWDAAHAAAPPADTLWVDLGPAASSTRAYVATPAGEAAAPALILVQEEGGPNGPMREVARRLSHQGYVAIVPDFDRDEPVATAEQAPERSPDPDPSTAVLDAVIQWLKAQPRTARVRVGVIGFGSGAARALEYALHAPSLGAVVTFYGAPVTDGARLGRLTAPLQAHVGTADPEIPRDRIEAFRAALRRAGKGADLYVYAGAGHGFMNEAGASFHADAARQAWARMLAFLQKHLKA